MYYVNNEKSKAEAGVVDRGIGEAAIKLLGVGETSGCGFGAGVRVRGGHCDWNYSGGGVDAAA